MSTQLIVKEFRAEDDYEEVTSWWKEHGWTPVGIENLPGTGVIVHDGKTKYCAAWLYLTDSKIAWIEWLVTNPKSPIKKRARSLGLAIDMLLMVAKTTGYSAVFSSLVNKNLVKLYKKHGFQTTDKNVTNLIARL